MIHINSLLCVDRWTNLRLGTFSMIIQTPQANSHFLWIIQNPSQHTVFLHTFDNQICLLVQIWGFPSSPTKSSWVYIISKPTKLCRGETQSFDMFGLGSFTQDRCLRNFAFVFPLWILAWNLGSGVFHTRPSTGNLCLGYFHQDLSLVMFHS